MLYLNVIVTLALAVLGYIAQQMHGLKTEINLLKRDLNRKVLTLVCNRQMGLHCVLIGRLWKLTRLQGLRISKLEATQSIIRTVE